MALYVSRNLREKLVWVIDQNQQVDILISKNEALQIL